jgi:threonine/homoserine/homoserine lactone efflux protein
MNSNAPIWVPVLVVLGTTIISIIGHLLYAVAFSTQSVIKIYNKFKSYFETALGVFFSYVGCKLLIDR